jgi:Raf kinase inhibitor-like YbhB/YbcL family protein
MQKVMQVFCITMLLLLMRSAFAMQIESKAFKNNALIPVKYTCDGENFSPPLTWREAPENSKSFALIIEDPDAPAGTWTHWILYNIPADINALAENMKQLPAGTKTGLNSWSKKEYGGPCPPSGQHHYHIKLYALDIMVPHEEDLNRIKLLQAIQAHILAEAEIIGLYR